MSDYKETDFVEEMTEVIEEPKPGFFKRVFTRENLVKGVKVAAVVIVSGISLAVLGRFATPHELKYPEETPFDEGDEKDETKT